MKHNWQIKKLGEVCEVLDKRRKPITKRHRASGEYPYYGATGILDYVSGFIFDEKLVLIGEDGAKWGSGDWTAFIAEGEYWVNNHAHVIRPNRDLILDTWIAYFFYFNDITKYTSGLTVPKLNQESLRNIEIPLPPLAEQKRIVKILDEAFEKIEKAKANTEKNLQNSRELFETCLDEILCDPKFEIKQLGEVCRKVEYGTSAKSKQKGSVAVLRMGNLQKGHINWDKLVYTDDAAEIKKYLLKYDDVLFNRTNSLELVGKTAIYKGEYPAIFAGYLIRIHRDEELLDANYLNYFLNSSVAMCYGRTVVTSSVHQANINGEKLKSYPIPLPSLSEQKAIVKKLDALAGETKKLEEIYTKKLASLEELKKSILQQAFAGEL